MTIGKCYYCGDRMFRTQEASAKIVHYEDGKVHHTVYYKDIEQARVQYKEYLDVGWKEEDYKLFLRKGTRWVNEA